MNIKETLGKAEKYLSEAYDTFEENGFTIPENKNLANLAQTVETAPKVYISNEAPTPELGKDRDYYIESDFETPYELISWAADQGLAEKLFPVGTMIDTETGKIVTEENPEHLTMRITSYFGTITENGEKKTSRPQLQSMRTLPDTYLFGSEDTLEQCEWRTCELRSKINSSELTDTLPADFVNNVKTSVVETCVKGSTETYETEDNFYIFSATELAAVGDGLEYKEGTQQTLFDGTPSNAEKNLNAKRQGLNSAGKGKAYWTRTAKATSEIEVWGMNSSGAFGAVGGSYKPTYASTFCIRLCCNL